MRSVIAGARAAPICIETAPKVFLSLSHISSNAAADAACSPDNVRPSASASLMRSLIPFAPPFIRGSMSAPDFPRRSIARAAFSPGSDIPASASATARSCSSGVMVERSAALRPTDLRASEAPLLPSFASVTVFPSFRILFSTVSMSVPDWPAAYANWLKASALAPVLWLMSSIAATAPAN